MCGTAGVIRLRRRIVERDRVAVMRMLHAEAHRGPDGEHIFADDVVCLGHRRLAIIDLSERARQPMANESSDVWVSANGEIYNFRELRSELEAAGHEFRSDTDVEVLVHGYEEWGLSGLLARARGMFAFALYDRRRRDQEKVFLVRDRFGIKPLYYSWGDEIVAFASELTALVAGGLVEPELDPNATTSFLGLGSMPGPTTALKDAKVIPAAHYLKVEDGRPSLERYWALSPTGVARTRDEISEILVESVRLHLVSDVPLGVFSSGGVDSATLVALASTETRAPLKTLSLGFDDVDLSEAGYARTVAERYHTEHHEITVGADDFVEMLPAVFEAMDSPTVDGVNTFFVSHAAKRAGLRVVLTGLGGDEVFLGYPHHRTWSRLGPMTGIFAKLPQSARVALVRLASMVSGKDRLDYLEDPSAFNVYRVFRGLFGPRQIGRLVDDPNYADTVEPSCGGGAPDLLDRALRLELELYLQHQLLRDTDTMSMAHSIEARVPFLDHRLVEAVYALPHEAKLTRGVNKGLLIEALDDPLPREVWDRPKQGFTFPFRRFLLSQRDELRARSKKGGLFPREAVDEVWDEFECGRAHWSRPWALVVFTAWVERLHRIASRRRDWAVDGVELTSMTMG